MPISFLGILILLLVIAVFAEHMDQKIPYMTLSNNMVETNNRILLTEILMRMILLVPLHVMQIDIILWKFVKKLISFFFYSKQSTATKVWMLLRHGIRSAKEREIAKLQSLVNVSIKKKHIYDACKILIGWNVNFQ